MRTTSRRRRRAVGLVVVALIVAVGACSKRTAPSPFDGESIGELRVVVDNQNFNDLRIYAVTTRGPQSLGQVGGRSQSDFRLEWRQLDEIRFRLEFLAGGQHNTMRINVSPGDIIEISIPQNPNNTIVRRR